MEFKEIKGLIDTISDPKIAIILCFLTYYGLKIVKFCFPILHF